MPTTYNKATLSTFFAQGDVPQGTDYQNLIYSQVNLVETAQQDMAGPLYTTKLITPLVSAASINVPGSFTTGSLSVNGIAVASGGTINGGLVITSALSVVGDMGVTGDTSLTSLYYLPGNLPIVSAAGTALATATFLVTANIVRGQGIADGQATGFKLLPADQRGFVQYFIYEGAVSANLWPAGSDYKINGLASGAAFAMAANTTYTIIYKTTSAYAVR